MYFLDHSFIPHMLNLSDAVIKAVVDMKQEILCDTDVSLASTERLCVASPCFTANVPPA